MLTHSEEVIMRFASHVLLAAALVSALVAPPVRAQQVEVEIGESLVCDTQQQVERFAALFDGDAERAASAVNEEVKDPTGHLPDHAHPGARRRDPGRRPRRAAGRLLLDGADRGTRRLKLAAIPPLQRWLVPAFG
jgi:hypothetical protein